MYIFARMFVSCILYIISSLNRNTSIMLQDMFIIDGGLTSFFSISNVNFSSVLRMTKGLAMYFFAN